MDTTTLIGVIVIAVFSITSHEAAHGFAADRLGDATAREHGRLTLNPIPHIDPFFTILLPLTLLLTGAPFIFGGAKPSVDNLIPSDMEIRGNHFTRPLSWRPGDPSYGGTAWYVKNLFELKNGQRVLFEGNLLEHNWPHVGTTPDATTCAPLDRSSGDLCAALPKTWACGPNGTDEANGVTKTASEGGGVLCCRD